MERRFAFLSIRRASSICMAWCIFVDPKSFIYLHGMVIDEVEPLPHQRLFKIKHHAMQTDGAPIRIFVDPKSFIYLHGMVLDFEETLMRQGFNFINPNSTKSCGCGSSFTA